MMISFKGWPGRVATLFLLALFFVAGPAAAVFAGNVTVLIYHRFGDQRYPTTNVTVERFAEQMAWLRENNFQVIPLADLVKALKLKQPLPEKGVVITIDDGYKSVYQWAWPILKQYGYPFTVFIYTKATDDRHWDYLTWDQVREMQAAGVDFQDHGYGHHRMALPPAGMDEAAYRNWIRDDLTKSHRILSRELGYRPRFLAVPYGEYNRTVINIAREAGYDAVFTQDPGSVSEQTGPMTIPREPILGKDWSTMDHFRMVLERVDLPITDPVPDMVPLVDPAPDAFSARLLFPERYRPGTVGIYVSELGWHQAVITDGVARIENKVSLKRRLNRVAISGRERESGRTAIRFWLLANPAADHP
ncbi:MAG: polysaccharide deacetylase family protein [Desulfobacterales bacterium]|nr:polysaccharide deacetylase family protein [Desulfobacterales bacterium]